ncbi:MAG: GntR family transcriptional regulator, partial [Alphaproteobacteria bacterium]|nr:GntR family transcriptional regulator [Alphaproteobacteria bacterium]
MNETLPLVAAPADAPSLAAHIYDTLRLRLITGQFAPGDAFSTRSLARELGVSQMPVRDALARLAAEGAIDIRSKRRMTVPVMTRLRYDDLMRCRLLLEPAAAVTA